MDASNVGGTRALLTAMRDAAPPPAHLVLISSQAAVGPSWDGRPVAENRDARPVSRYGRSKRGAERLAIREPRPVSVVRPPTVYGPRERDVLSYFRLVHRGILPVLSHETTLSIVYVHNLIDALLRVLGGPAPPPGGRILHVADAGATSMAAFGVMIAAHYHRHVHRVVVPVAFLAALGFLLEGLSVASGKAALLGRDKLREIRQPAWLLSTRASANLLGYAPALDTAAGIAETARWYAEHGWL
jgi:nucleoside-diphosphate-sugar epimerase